jgi:outer membrane protein assembly factor BamB
MQGLRAQRSLVTRRRPISAAAALFAAAAVLAAPAGASATGWRQYGFDARHTSTNPAESALTPSTVPRLTPGWARRIAAGAYLLSTPTVAGGRVFVVDQGGPVVAFDAATGRRLWTVSGGGDGQAAVAAGRVFVCLGGVVRALDPRTGAAHFTAGPCAGPPAIDGARGFVYAGAIRAWSTATGRALWRSPRRIALLDQVPTVGDGRVFGEGRGRDRHNVYVFDEATGRLLNVRHAGGGCASEAPPWLCGYDLMAGSAIVGGNLWTVEFQWCAVCADTDGWAYLRAFPIAPGAWTPPDTNEITNNWDASTPPPVVGFGHAYVPNLSLEDAYPVRPHARGWVSGVTATMNVTLAGRVAYFADCGCALATATGRLLWSSGSRWALAAPAIANGVVYWPQGDELRTYRLPAP